VDVLSFQQEIAKWQRGKENATVIENVEEKFLPSATPRTRLSTEYNQLSHQHVSNY
jgi:hypothetical protein